MRAVRVLVVALLLFVPTVPTLAQARGGPSVTGVLAVRSYDSLRESISYLSRLSGQPTAIEQFDGMITAFTGGRGLEGIDTRRPLGLAFITYDGENSVPFAFFPVKDKNAVESLLQRVGPQIFALTGPQPFRVTPRWFFIGPGLRQPGDLPDPAAIVSRLARDYDIAFSANLKHLPDSMRRNLQSSIDRGVELGALAQPADSAAEAEGRKAGAKLFGWVFQQFLNDTEELVFGVRLSPRTGKLVFDLSVVARTGSDLATMASSLSRAARRFGNLVDSSSFTGMSVSVALSAESKQALLAMLPKELRNTGTSAILGTEESHGRSPFSDAELPAELRELLGIMRKTVEAGWLDGALALRGNPPAPLTIVGGAQLVNPREVETWLQTQVHTATKKGTGDGYRFNVAQYRATRIHEFQPRVTDADLKAAFGNPAKLHVAFGRDTCFFAFGGDSLSALKWAVDCVEGRRGLPGSAQPMVFQANVGTWLDILSTVEPELVSLRKKLTGGDQFRLSVDPLSQGFRMRFELEEGVLRLIMSQASRQASFSFPR